MNLVNPDMRVKSAINRLNGAEDFQIFLGLLRAELDQVDKRNRHLQNPVELHQGQGYAQALDSVLKLCEEAYKAVALK